MEIRTGGASVSGRSYSLWKPQPRASSGAFFAALARPVTGDYIQAICGRFIQSRGPLRYAALMRINLWIVLVVLMALLAVTQLLRYRQDTQRICADDPSASVCGR